MPWTQHLRIAWVEEIDFWKESFSGFFKLYPTLGWLGKAMWLLLAINPAFWATMIMIAVVFRSLLHALDLWRWWHRQPTDFDAIHVDIPESAWGPEISIAQAEADNSTYPERRSIDGIPFGFQHEYWLELRNYMRPGDRLHHYRFSNEEGYVLVRNENSVAKICLTDFFETCGEFVIEDEQSETNSMTAQISGTGS